MRKLIAFLLLTMISFGAVAQTFTLVSDPIDPRTEFIQIELNAVEVLDCGDLSTPCIGLDSGGLPIVTWNATLLVRSASGVVRARACLAGGVCSAWTAEVPFDFTAPGVPGGLRFVVG